MDILRKQVQDSLISEQCRQIEDLTDRTEKQQLTINNLYEIVQERWNMIIARDNQVNSYQIEIAGLKKDVAKNRRQRNIAIGIGIGLLSLIAIK